MFEKKKSVLLFLLPGLAMLMIFYIVPFFSGIGYSLTDGSYKNTFVGLQNYRDLWQNSMFLLGLKNTMELSLICAPLLWILSFLSAGQRAERDQAVRRILPLERADAVSHAVLRDSAGVAGDLRLRRPGEPRA